MSYETSPTTAMLATHCAACARPLVDAVSVETGIGPECRKRYGIRADDAHRDEANALVYQIALRQNGPDVSEYVRTLHALGFKALAARIAKRLGVVRVEREGSTLHVVAPFSPDFAAALRKNAPASRWNREGKRWEIPAEGRLALWRAIVEAFRGSLVSGPDGFKVAA